MKPLFSTLCRALGFWGEYPQAWNKEDLGSNTAFKWAWGGGREERCMEIRRLRQEWKRILLQQKDLQLWHEVKRKPQRGINEAQETDKEVYSFVLSSFIVANVRYLCKEQLWVLFFFWETESVFDCFYYDVSLSRQSINLQHPPDWKLLEMV